MLPNGASHFLVDYLQEQYVLEFIQQTAHKYANS